MPKDLCDPESGDSRPESTWGSIAGHFAACSDDMASRAGAADFGRNGSIETIACSMLLFRFKPFLSVYRARRQDVGSQRLEGLRVRPIGPPWMLQPCNRNLTAGDGRSRGIIRGNISKLISLPLSLGSPDGNTVTGRLISLGRGKTRPQETRFVSRTRCRNSSAHPRGRDATDEVCDH